MTILQTLLVIGIAGYYFFLTWDVYDLHKDYKQLRKEFDQVKEDIYKYIIVKNIDNNWIDKCLQKKQ